MRKIKKRKTLSIVNLLLSLPKYQLSIIVAIMLLAASCGQTAPKSNTEPALSETETVTEPDTPASEVREALDLVFDYLYNTGNKERMSDKQFIDSDVFFGYEYNYRTLGKWCLEFYKTSDDGNYFIFWLYEIVYDDGEDSHAVTSNHYAIHKNTKEIIEERGFDENHEFYFNDDFPW